MPEALKQARAVKGHKPASMLVNPINASILRHLSEGELSISELSRIMGLSKSLISYHLSRLEEEGLIERTREEIYRGGVRKFYRAVSSLQLPRLSDLSGAEKESFLLPVKAFLWGYLVGKFEGRKWDLDRLAGEIVDKYAHDIAAAMEQMVVRGENLGEGKAHELYLKLLIRLTREHLKEGKIKLEPLGLDDSQ